MPAEGTYTPMQRPIEQPIGSPVEHLDTPALLVDIAKLDASAAELPAGCRIEAWVHNTPAIVWRQLRASRAVGIAVRGVAEAEVFAAAGCQDIRILRPLVTAAGRRRAAALARSARIVTGDDGAPLDGADSLAAAVSVSARVTSTPEAGRAITDCGQKAVGQDFGPPRVCGRHGCRASASSAEHGVLVWPAGAPDVHPFALGEWLRLAPADVATVFALHDFAYGIEDGRLAAVWRVNGRGMFQ